MNKCREPEFQRLLIYCKVHTNILINCSPRSEAREIVNVFPSAITLKAVLDQIWSPEPTDSLNHSQGHDSEDIRIYLVYNFEQMNKFHKWQYRHGIVIFSDFS